MDLSKFTTPDWLKVGGALGVFVFGMFAWASGGGETGGNAFDFTFTGTIPWLLIVAAGVVSFLLAAGVMKRQPDGPPWDLILLAAFGLGAFLIVFRLISGPSFDTPLGTFEADRGPGLFLSAFSAALAAVGALLAVSAGGDETRPR